jgi:hypothetical protein
MCDTEVHGKKYSIFTLGHIFSAPISASTQDFTALTFKCPQTNQSYVMYMITTDSESSFFEDIIVCTWTCVK